MPFDPVRDASTAPLPPAYSPGGSDRRRPSYFDGTEDDEEERQHQQRMLHHHHQQQQQLLHERHQQEQRQRTASYQSAQGHPQGHEAPYHSPTHHQQPHPHHHPNPHHAVRGSPSGYGHPDEIAAAAAAEYERHRRSSRSASLADVMNAEDRDPKRRPRQPSGSGPSRSPHLLVQPLERDPYAHPHAAAAAAHQEQYAAHHEQQRRLSHEQRLQHEQLLRQEHEQRLQAEHEHRLQAEHEHRLHAEHEQRLQLEHEMRLRHEQEQQHRYQLEQHQRAEMAMEQEHRRRSQQLTPHGMPAHPQQRTRGSPYGPGPGYPPESPSQQPSLRNERSPSLQHLLIGGPSQHPAGREARGQAGSPSQQHPGGASHAHHQQLTPGPYTQSPVDSPVMNLGAPSFAGRASILSPTTEHPRPRLSRGGSDSAGSREASLSGGSYRDSPSHPHHPPQPPLLQTQVTPRNSRFAVPELPPARSPEMTRAGIVRPSSQEYIGGAGPGHHATPSWRQGSPPDSSYPATPVTPGGAPTPGSAHAGASSYPWPSTRQSPLMGAGASSSPQLPDERSLPPVPVPVSRSGAGPARAGSSTPSRRSPAVPRTTSSAGEPSSLEAMRRASQEEGRPTSSSSRGSAATSAPPKRKRGVSPSSGEADARDLAMTAAAMAQREEEEARHRRQQQEEVRNMGLGGLRDGGAAGAGQKRGSEESPTGLAGEAKRRRASGREDEYMAQQQQRSYSPPPPLPKRESPASNLPQAPIRSSGRDSLPERPRPASPPPPPQPKQEPPRPAQPPPPAPPPRSPSPEPIVRAPYRPTQRVSAPGIVRMPLSRDSLASYRNRTANPLRQQWVEANPGRSDGWDEMYGAFGREQERDKERRAAFKASNGQAVGASKEDPSTAAAKRKEAAALAVAEHYNSRPEAGLAARDQSPIIGLKKFNNWVKSVIIATFSRRRGRVLDLGAGKGGDLQKWGVAGVEEMVLVDIASVSIEQARQRYLERPQRFKADFYAFDAFGTPLEDVIPREVLSPMFDTVSLQFCMHYAWSSVQKAQLMLENVSKWLRPGGVFIGTIPDADRLRGQLQSLPGDELSFGNRFYRVTFDASQVDKKHRPPLFGHKYNFWLLDAIDECDEYVVDWQQLQSLAMQNGLRCIYRETFNDVWHKESRREPHAGLLRRQGIPDPGRSEFPMDPELWEAASIYLAFAFEKMDRPGVA